MPKNVPDTFQPADPDVHMCVAGLIGDPGCLCSWGRRRGRTRAAWGEGEEEGGALTG